MSDATGARDYIAGPWQRTFSPLFNSYRSLMADMMGLRYIVSSVHIGEVDAALKPGDLRFLARTRDGYVYENPRALPRVLFAVNWVAADFDTLIDHSPRRAWSERHLVSRSRRVVRDLRPGDRALQQPEGRGRPVHRAEELTFVGFVQEG